ncbi:hypothetical protein Tco_0804863 [Tanacetum coccineum]
MKEEFPDWFGSVPTSLRNAQVLAQQQVILWLVDPTPNPISVKNSCVVKGVRWSINKGCAPPNIIDLDEDDDIIDDEDALPHDLADSDDEDLVNVDDDDGVDVVYSSEEED